MKKALATILALVMALGLTTAAWADGEVAEITKNGATTKYATLKAAIENVADGETIVLTADVNNGDGIVVASGKNFTLDFAGHAYKITQNVVGSTGTESQCFQLLKDSTITMKNGTIVADYIGARMIIQNYCNLTLDNMKLDATAGNNKVGYVVSNNCGNVFIKNGTTITAKTTGVAFDVYGGFPNYGDVSVTLEAGATVNGKVEVARGTGTQNKNTLTVTGGTVNGELVVTANEKTEVAVTGGTFSSDVSTHTADDTPVASNERTNERTTYYVGAETIQNVASSLSVGQRLVIRKGTVRLTGVPAGVIVRPANNTVVFVNGKDISNERDGYTVPQSSGYYYAGPSISAVLNGSNKSATDYTSGDYGLIFRSTASYSGFQGVQVDGKALAKGNYTVEDNGGTEVYLKAVYLKTLAAGKHTVTILSSAGNTSMDFTIGGKTTAPQTFDAGIALYVGMALTSVAGAAFAVKKRED